MSWEISKATNFCWNFDFVLVEYNWTRGGTQNFSKISKSKNFAEISIL